MNGGWAHLAWRSLPLLLVLVWFLGLIGGISVGGLLHMVLLAAAVLFGYQMATHSSG